MMIFTKSVTDVADFVNSAQIRKGVSNVKKKLCIILVAILVCSMLWGCGSENVDLDKGINFPSAPFGENANAMITDQYRFYNIDATNTEYWHTANTHDPVMIKEGDTYYVFSTDAQYGTTTQKGLHVRKSSDMIKWDFVGTALDINSVNEAIDYVGYNKDGIKVDFFWAPEIVKRPKANGGSEFWLFYCISAFGERNSYIGVAKSDSITGPYVHSHEILRTHQTVGSPNAIDPAILVEGEGENEQMWMTYGSWNAGINLIELDAATGEPKIQQKLVRKTVACHTAVKGQTVQEEKLVPALADDPAFGTTLLQVYSAEAPHLMKHGSYYYLFVTTGKDLTYDYDVRVFRSEDIAGPYVDAEGRRAADKSGESTFRQYGNKITDAHRFKYEDGDKKGWAAIGHCSTFTEGDQTYFLSHYRGTYIDSARFFLGIRKMFFVGDWPVVAANRYAGEQSQDMTGLNISGKYLMHILSKRVCNATLNSNKITVDIDAITLELKSNGEVDSELYDGSWKFTGENKIEIKLGSTTYKGIVSPQWSWERNRGVLGISAISNKGEALWANRT